MTPASLIAARGLDPLNTPPDSIALAVAVPETVQLADGDAILRLALATEPEGDSFAVDETVPLRLSSSDDDLPEAQTGQTIYLARLGPEEAERIAEAQAQITALRAAGPTGQGSLTVAVTGGCLLGPVPASLPVSTWLQTDPGAGFVQLTRQRDMFRVLDPADAAALRAGLLPCGT
ncbi:hypothetical protein [uncultured Roseobacter sp.]|uniref:hypothetical protein n=1 Tax=uncultured Roseobacter sp. TaxID=114847 RepID=UPI00261B3DC3|nr:hypothetical protein [uncultured Roseobacter sp.]